METSKSYNITEGIYLKNKNIISIKDMTKEEINKIHEITEKMEQIYKSGSEILKGKILGVLFFEPSTRTRLSFESAMIRLGGSVIGFATDAATSIKKGETLADTIRTVSNYCDAIAIRHPSDGAAKVAAEFSDVPIINAGSGSEEHPTQALLDLYTIRKELGKIDGLTIMLAGDLKYGRTIHSLIHALSNYDVKLILASPKELSLNKQTILEIKRKGINIIETNKIDTYVSQIDVIYMTRIQKERFLDPSEYNQLKGKFILNSEMLSNAKENMIVMHPLPRVDEITPDVDNTRHARYFKQVYYGVVTRMAILDYVFGE